MVRLRSRDSEQERFGECYYCKDRVAELYDAGHIDLCDECFELDMNRKPLERDKVKDGYL